jgi:hypothetical protein
MYHTTSYDLIVTASVISAILLIACKPEWCARQVWRVLRVVIPTALVLLEVDLLFTHTSAGLVLLAFALVGWRIWESTAEQRRIERNLKDWRAGLTSLNPALGPYQRQAARWDARMLEERSARLPGRVTSQG